MRKKAIPLLCALVMAAAMSVTVMAAPSPEFPDNDYLYEDPIDSEKLTETDKDDTETTNKPSKPEEDRQDFSETEYLLEETPNPAGKSDTSPKTGEGMGILYAAMAAAVCGGMAYTAKKHL